MTGSLPSRRGDPCLAGHSNPGFEGLAGWPLALCSPASSSTANITVFKPTSFFVLVQTGLGLQLQVQLVPLMQVHIVLDPSHHGQMCGEGCSSRVVLEGEGQMGMDGEAQNRPWAVLGGGQAGHRGQAGSH